MASEFDDTPLRSLVSGLVDENGRIRLEDFTQLVCEQMGVSEEQASDVARQLDPSGEGYIDVDLIYQTFQALLPAPGNVNNSASTAVESASTVNGDDVIELTNNGDDDGDDDAPPALPETPEPAEYQSFQAEEFFGEVQDEDVIDGVMSPVRGSRTPRRTSGFSLTPTSASSSRLGQNAFQSLGNIMNGGDLEEQDVLHDEQMKLMTFKVSQLNEQLSAALEERDSSESMQRKTKQEYSSMQARVHHMEEQLREREENHQQALRTMQEKHKLKMSHLENKLTTQMSGMKAQMSSSQDEVRQLNAQDSSLRDQLKEAKKEAATMKEEYENVRKTLAKRESDQSALVAQQRRETEGASATIAHLQEQLQEVTQRSQRAQEECTELQIRNQRSKTAVEQSSLATQHLEEEVARVQKEVTRVGARNNDLSAQLIKQGKMLMEAPDGGKDPESLEAEMNEQSKDEIMKSLREERNYGMRLKEYVDNMLIVVMEQSPHLLEVRSSPSTSAPSSPPAHGT